MNSVAAADPEPRFCDILQRITPRLPIWAYPGNEEAYDVNEFRAALAEAQRVVIDNAAEFFYAVSPKEHWDIAKDFPAVAPPWPLFWMEFKKPSRIYSDQAGVLSTKGFPKFCGALFMGRTARDVSEEISNLPVVELRKRLRDEIKRYETAGVFVELKEKIQAYRATGVKQEIGSCAAAYQLAGLLREWQRLETGQSQLQVPDTELNSGVSGGWLVWASVFLLLHGVPIGPVTYMNCWITEQGAILGSSLRFLAPGKPPGLFDPHTLIYPFLFGLSLLHCKNTELETIQPTAYNQRHLQRRFPPLFRYHVLKVAPNIKARGGRHGPSDLKVGLHICRGHFKKFEQKGLFGKWKGLFWWDMHWRGDPGLGLVQKEYQVERG